MTNLSRTFHVFPVVPSPTAAFGPFTLNLETLELRRGADRVTLEPQPARLLALLVSRAGHVVLRDEAAACLWGEGTHVSRSEGLHYAVRHIRRALGDDAVAPAFVETLPRKGYRFVAPVHIASECGVSRRRQTALAAAAAGVLAIAELLPNSHHEAVVWLLHTVHAALF